MTLPTRAELAKESFRELLHRYAYEIDDTTVMRMPREDLAPNGHPNTEEGLREHLYRFYRI